MLLCSARQGDWVWLKKCPNLTLSSVNSNTESTFVNVSTQIGIMLGFPAITVTLDNK